MRDNLKAMAMLGTLRGPGGKLRAVRDLAGTLGISHVAVVKALKALDRDEPGWRG
ncbi:MAG: hypothetical protein U1E17_05765 [Geminicoccaceae bacterium]